MTRAGEKVLARILWALYGVLGIGGLAVLVHVLFVPSPPRPFTLKMTPVASTELHPFLLQPQDELVERRFTRRVAAAAADGPTRAQPVSLDQLIKLTGILDFAGKQPTLAVIESGGESKAYKVGDKVGETGVLIKAIKEYIVVEFEKRRFKVTFAGIQELPANAVGKD